MLGAPGAGWASSKPGAASCEASGWVVTSTFLPESSIVALPPRSHCIIFVIPIRLTASGSAGCCTAFRVALVRYLLFEMTCAASTT